MTTQRGSSLLSILGLSLLAACATTRQATHATDTTMSAPDDPRRVAIEAELDDFHAAAAAADGDRYFAHFSEDGVFLGTDASERWNVAEFRAYATPHFDQGNGWTYHPRERHVTLGEGGRSAWFDERLWNEKYGECRGTGVLRAVAGRWLIAHYSLTFPIPNTLAAEFTQRIRELDSSAR